MSNATLITDYLECWGSRDVDAVRSYISPGCVFTDPILGESLSAEAFIDGTTSFVSLISTVKIRETLSEGDVVAARYDVETIFGQWVHCSQWFELREGKIVYARLHYDSHQLRLAARREKTDD